MFPSCPLFSIVSQPFKRSQLGLFQGRTKQYGNNVPFSKHKTRRTWLPNVQRKRLFSDTLGENVRVKVTTRALKTIKKHNGIDNYLSQTRAETLGWEGMRLRLMIRDHAEKKAAGETGGTEGPALDSEQTQAPNIDAQAKKWGEKRTALRELEALRRRKPTLESAREDRLHAMTTLNLNYRPSARRTIQFLKDRKESLLQRTRQ